MKRNKAKTGIVNRHDKAFRKSMSDVVIATSFLEQHLPINLVKNLDFSTLTQLKTEHIDERLRETFCDVVFDCQFIDKSKENLKIILLVEHQSTPVIHMPFRVYYYAFSMLHNELYSRMESQHELLPPIYSLVFYHGEPKEYPFSLELKSSFHNPNNIMEQFFSNKINLVNIHDYSDNELLSQKAHGIISYALKHGREQYIDDLLYDIFNAIIALDSEGDTELKSLDISLIYLLDSGKVKDIDKFIQFTNQLPNKLKGGVMTAADQLKDWVISEVKKEGKIEANRETAINALKEGADVRFVAKITKLTVAEVEIIKAELES